MGIGHGKGDLGFTRTMLWREFSSLCFVFVVQKLLHILCSFVQYNFQHHHSLLQHKIVVTAQRDTYEDHYRLMEALVGGALVFTDPMHPLPYMLEDGKNVIMYSSISDLKEKILYYINDPAGQKKRVQIAKKGYEVVMNYHRSWHVMERLIFDDEGA